MTKMDNNLNQEIIEQDKSDNKANLSDLEETIDSSLNISKLQEKIDFLETNNIKLTKELHEIKTENFIDLALIQNGAKNLKAVKSLIDFSTLSDDENKITEEINRQIEALKLSNDSSFLFENNKFESIKGADILENIPDGKNIFSDLKMENINLTEQSDLCKSNPSLAKKIARTLFGA